MRAMRSNGRMKESGSSERRRKGGERWFVITLATFALVGLWQAYGLRWAGWLFA